MALNQADLTGIVIHKRVPMHRIHFAPISCIGQGFQASMGMPSLAKLENLTACLLSAAVMCSVQMVQVTYSQWDMFKVGVSFDLNIVMIMYNT